MAKLPDNFNAENYKDTDFSLIVPGEYTAMLVSSEAVRTKSGTGWYYKLEFELVDEYQGRKVWENLNYNNPNKKAVEIALGKFSSLCRAVGVMKPKDTIELHDEPFTIVIGVKEDKGYKPKNVVKGYKSISGNPTTGPKRANVDKSNIEQSFNAEHDDGLPF